MTSARPLGCISKTGPGEKLAAMNTAAYFAERRKRADLTAFDRLMRRKGGEAPRPADKIS